MKKVLLSLAVIAASGGYVAFENANPQTLSGLGLAGSGGGLVSTTALTVGIGATAADPANPAKLATPVAIVQTQAAAPASPPPPPAVTQPEIAQTTSPVAAPISVVASGDLATSTPPQAGTTDQLSGNPPAVPIPVTPPADLRNRTTVATADQTQLQGQTQPQGNGTQSFAVAALTAQPPLPRARPANAPSASATIRVAQTGYRDGTFKGPSMNAYYGRVQLSAVINSGQIQRIQVLDFPNDMRRSQYINSIALPMLEQEAVQAQSANIDIVSGATLTSEAFIRSLSGALSPARG